MDALCYASGMAATHGAVSLCLAKPGLAGDDEVRGSIDTPLVSGDGDIGCIDNQPGLREQIRRDTSRLCVGRQRSHKFCRDFRAFECRINKNFDVAHIGSSFGVLPVTHAGFRRTFGFARNNLRTLCLRVCRGVRVPPVTRVGPGHADTFRGSVLGSHKIAGPLLVKIRRLLDGALHAHRGGNRGSHRLGCARALQFVHVAATRLGRQRVARHIFVGDPGNHHRIRGHRVHRLGVTVARHAGRHNQRLTGH